MRRNYLLKCHEFYADKVDVLKLEILKLKATLDREAYLQHPDVKFAVRLRQATQVIIPEDPTKQEYQLHGD